MQVQIQLLENLDKKKNRRTNRVQNPKIWTITLTPNSILHTHKGDISHNEIINLFNSQPENNQNISSILTTSEGVYYQVLTPRLCDIMLANPRGAAIIYPKDASQILMFGDIRSNQEVLECGLGSGAMTLSLLEAVGKTGSVTSVEKREDFAKTASKNIKNYYNGQIPENWNLELIDFGEYLDKIISSNKIKYDRIVLDLLNPWDYLKQIYSIIKPGAIVSIYVTTTPQLQSLSETIAKINGEDPLKVKWTNIECFETIRRPWNLEKLSIRPEHQGILHSGFIITLRAVF
ncbi:MAG: hypothetical protein LBM13_02390 [Candidatus Ancillula sp.]|jgi:tRNA (adenine57-N1/adenine58-N1)-methyltransferase|nr:hypothetical protein [Candidatus Ancillula sp.]